MALKPSDCVNINQCVISGVLSQEPLYYPHSENPRWDAAHFMIYQFIGGSGQKGRRFVVNTIPVQVYGAIARFCRDHLAHGDEIIGTGFMKTNNPDKGTYRTEFHIRQIQKLRHDGIDGSDWVITREDVYDDWPENSTVF